MSFQICPGGESKSCEMVSCSICLEALTDNGDRSWAKLQCGHKFHLDCIGSAFNMKGAMQCPNCRKLEKGQWLYANGSWSSYPEASMHDGHSNHDDDPNDSRYLETSPGVQWCPFTDLAHLPSFFDEGDIPSATYPDVSAYNTIPCEDISSASHYCPHDSYFGQFHQPSSNSNGSASSGSEFSSHWHDPSIANEMQQLYAFIDLNSLDNIWEQRSLPVSTNSSHVGAADQPSSHPVPQRPARVNSDVPMLFGTPLHPFLAASSGGGGLGASMFSSYSVSDISAHDRVQPPQSYHELQPGNSPVIGTTIAPGTRGSSSLRGSAQLGPVGSSSDLTSSFQYSPFNYPPGSASMNLEIFHQCCLHALERDRMPTFYLNLFERDSI